MVGILMRTYVTRRMLACGFWVMLIHSVSAPILLILLRFLPTNWESLPYKICSWISDLLGLFYRDSISFAMATDAAKNAAYKLHSLTGLQVQNIVLLMDLALTALYGGVVYFAIGFASCGLAHIWGRLRIRVPSE